MSDLLAIEGVSRGLRVNCFSKESGGIIDIWATMRSRRGLRSCASLAALSLETANALLAPFRPHSVDWCSKNAFVVLEVG